MQKHESVGGGKKKVLPPEVKLISIQKLILILNQSHSFSNDKRNSGKN